MSKARLVSLVLAVGLALALAGTPSLKHAEMASVQPSWEVLEGEPNSCIGSGGGFGLSAYINNPTAASEKGSFQVPGFGEVGYTQDTGFSGIGTFSFFVFGSAPYTVPANTPVTLTVTTYNLPSYAGGISYVDTITWDCTTGAILSHTGGAPAAPVAEPGCDVELPVPSSAVGGTFVADAPVYWAPGQLASPSVTIQAGKSAKVIGLDQTGQYYKIAWACNLLWVPTATLGPNYDAVWQGRPLPTTVVS